MRATVLVVVDEGSLWIIGCWTLTGMSISSSIYLFLSGITIGSFFALSVFPNDFLTGCDWETTCLVSSCDGLAGSVWGYSLENAEDIGSLTYFPRTVLLRSGFGASFTSSGLLFNPYWALIGAIIFSNSALMFLSWDFLHVAPKVQVFDRKNSQMFSAP